MKEGRSYLKVTLTERGSRRQESRHPWVYDNEVGNADEGIKDGDLVDVITAGGKYSGTGFYNSNSKISVRIISRNATIPSIRLSGKEESVTPLTTDRP